MRQPGLWFVVCAGLHILLEVPTARAELSGVIDLADVGVTVHGARFDGMRTAQLLGNSLSSGDINGDGATDGTDFGIWNAHRSQEASPRYAPIPETHSWVSFVVLSLVSSFHRRRLVGHALHDESQACSA